MNVLLYLLVIPAATQPADPPPWANPNYILPVALILVFMLMMTKNKPPADKSQVDLLKNLKRGDRIQTIGGVLGTVNDVRDNEIVVKVDENANIKIRFARDAIRKVLSDDDKLEKK